jgi:dinuclear metal center YbgI/SA1388 family protein
MTTTVNDIIACMEELAPANHAESWDNCGLQVGSGEWPVRKIMVALDPSRAVVDQACTRDIDLLITHHPLIFKPLKQIDVGRPPGNLIHMALCRQMAIFAAHTNLDAAAGGVNDHLCEAIGLVETVPLAASGSEDGTWGIGRVGRLAQPMGLAHFAAAVKSSLGLSSVRIAGNNEGTIEKVAVCSGSGSGLLADFFRSGADVYVSGDLKYHDAMTITDAGLKMVDVGHFCSEHLIVPVLAEKIEAWLRARGKTASVLVSAGERDPFITL